VQSGDSGGSSNLLWGANGGGQTQVREGYSKHPLYNLPRLYTVWTVGAKGDGRSTTFERYSDAEERVDVSVS